MLTSFQVALTDLGRSPDAVPDRPRTSQQTDQNRIPAPQPQKQSQTQTGGENIKYNSQNLSALYILCL